MKAQPNASHYVNGRFIDDERGASTPVIYPTTGEVIAKLHSATPNIVELVVEAARCAGRMGTAETDRARPHFAPRLRHLARPQCRAVATGNP